MNKNNNDYESTDRLDITEIHRRFYNDDYNDNSHNHTEKKNNNKKHKEEKNIEKNKVKNRSKSKLNFTSVIIFLTTLLLLSTIVLVVMTVSNNKRLNDKIKDLTNITETTKETEATEPTEEATKETEATEPQGSGETKSGRLIQALNLRSGPGYDYSVIATIPEGTEVSGEIVNGWLKIEYNGQVGYIGPKFVQ